MQVVNGLSKRANVDTLRSEGGAHRSHNRLHRSSERRNLVRGQIRYFVNVALRLQEHVPSDQPIHAVVGDPMGILVDEAARRYHPTRVHVTSDAAGHNERV